MGLTQLSDKPASAMAAGVDLGVLQDVGAVNSDQERENQKVKPQSYADRLKTNIRYDQRLKRNVLDIEI